MHRIARDGKKKIQFDTGNAVIYWCTMTQNSQEPPPARMSRAALSRKSREKQLACSAVVCDDETLRADAERAKKEWQAVELNGDSMAKRRSANEIWLAAYMAGRRAA